MENIPQKSQSVSEKLQELKSEKDRVMQELQEKSSKVKDLWFQQRSAETQEEKERIIKKGTRRIK
jgi:vacuolar-type H+-ATPase subunit H